MPATSVASKSVSARAHLENMAYLRLDPHYCEIERALKVASRKASAIEEKAKREAWAKSYDLPAGAEQDKLRYARVKTDREQAAWAEVIKLRAQLTERRAYLDQVSAEYAV